jgi:hypothetical protein
MGILASLKRKNAERTAHKAQSDYNTLHDAWKTHHDKLTEYITVVRDCAEGRMNEQLVDHSDYGFMLNPTEIPVAYLPLALYYEADETHDEGSAIITTERVLYAGALATREWVFKKLINITHSPAGYSVFATTGVGTPGGIAYGPDVAMEVQFRIELGAAIARDRLPQFLSELDTTLATHNTQMPVPPPPSASTTA